MQMLVLKCKYTHFFIHNIFLDKKESITSSQALSSDIVKPQLSVIVPEFLNRKARYGTILELFFHNTRYTEQRQYLVKPGGSIAYEIPHIVFHDKSAGLKIKIRVHEVIAGLTIIEVDTVMVVNGVEQNGHIFGSR